MKSNLVFFMVLYDLCSLEAKKKTLLLKNKVFVDDCKDELSYISQMSDLTNRSCTQHYSFNLLDFLNEVANQHNVKMKRNFLPYLTNLPLNGNVNLHLAKLVTLVQRLDVKGSLIVDEGDPLNCIANSDKFNLNVDGQLQNQRNRVEKSDVAESVFLFLDLLERDPDDMISVVTSIVYSKYSISSETFQLVSMGLKMFPKTGYFSLLIRCARSFIHSVSSQNLLDLIPALIGAVDLQEVLDIVQVELNVNMQHISEWMMHSGISKEVLDKSARILSAAMMQLDTFFEDKRKSFAINSLLASQGLPTINPKKIISSGLQFMEKFLHFFTSWKLDQIFGEQLVINHFQYFEKRGISWDVLVAMESEQRIELMKKNLVKIFGEPLDSLIEAQHNIFSRDLGVGCAEYYLCQINAKVNQVGIKTELQKYASRVLSLFFARAWGLCAKMDTLKLYRAIFEGTEEQICFKKYVKKFCQV